jgi:cystathionine beta-lyase/cystathionine gamma-synthase
MHPAHPVHAATESMSPPIKKTYAERMAAAAEKKARDALAPVLRELEETAARWNGGRGGLTTSAAWYAFKQIENAMLDLGRADAAVYETAAYKSSKQRANKYFMRAYRAWRADTDTDGFGQS